MNRLSATAVTATHLTIFLRPLKRVDKRIRAASISPCVWQTGNALKMKRNENSLLFLTCLNTAGWLKFIGIKKRINSVIAQPVANPAARFLFHSLPPTTTKYPVKLAVLNTALAHLAFYFRASYIDKHNFTHSAFVFRLQISKLT